MSIQIKNLTHVYSSGMPHETKALEDISFSVEDGEFLGVIGHTGSGKSTLVQHLNGILKATSGNIVINGTDITDPKVSMLEIRRKIGLVFQYPEYQLFEETVAKDVAFGPRNLGLDEVEIEARVKEAIELVKLNYEEIKDRSPFDLSGGQKRRVAIAGVIAMKPEVLILDEPTAGLDPKAHEDVLNMIKEIHQKQKNIIVFVSHNMNDVARLSDKIIVIDNGKLIIQGKPEEVFSEGARLQKIGLALPDVTRLAVERNKRGFNIAENKFNLEDVFDEILDEIKGAKAND